MNAHTTTTDLRSRTARGAALALLADPGDTLDEPSVALEQQTARTVHRALVRALTGAGRRDLLASGPVLSVDRIARQGRALMHPADMTAVQGVLGSYGEEATCMLLLGARFVQDSRQRRRQRAPRTTRQAAHL